MLGLAPPSKRQNNPLRREHNSLALRARIVEARESFLRVPHGTRSSDAEPENLEEPARDTADARLQTIFSGSSRPSEVHARQEYESDNRTSSGPSACPRIETLSHEDMVSGNSCR